MLSILYKSIRIFLLLLMILSLHMNKPVYAQSNNRILYYKNRLPKTMIMDYHKSKTANVWITLSNWGIIADIEWPGGSNNNYAGGANLWIGGKDPNNKIHCSEAGPNIEAFTPTMNAQDIVQIYDNSNPNFYFRPNAHPSFQGREISDEDTYAEYSDIDRSKHIDYSEWPLEAGEPLGLKVIERTYKWNTYYNDDFIIFDYQIINIGLDTDDDLIPDTPQEISDVYIGIRLDADISSSAGGWYNFDDLPGFIYEKNLSFMYDSDNPYVEGNDTGENGLSTGYIYMRLLKAAGGTPYVFYDKPHGHTYWQWGGSPQLQEEPLTELAKYNYLSTADYKENPDELSDYRIMQSAGPFNMDPGDTVNVVWALGVGDGKEGMIEDSDWAKFIYDHEYVAGPPPDPPTLSIIKGNDYIKLTWDNAAENSVDIFSGKQDFEGYRVYKSSRYDELGNKIWIKLADYDKVNIIGANTGLQYEYIDRDVLYGFAYSYAVTAYDRGDLDLGLDKLESGVREEKSSVYVTMGPPAKNSLDEIYVYPNPYVGSAQWDHVYTEDEPFRRKLVFTNLPAGKITINIFTLDGDLVDTIEQNTGETIATWDLLTRHDREIVSGIYIYSVETEIGIHLGKFVVIQ